MKHPAALRLQSSQGCRCVNRPGDIPADDRVGACGGVWFDRFGIGRVDRPSEAAAEALLRIARSPAIEVDPGQRGRRPRCAMPMMRHFLDVKRPVTLDGWPKCAGGRGGRGELVTIRRGINGGGERKQAAVRYFDDIVGGQLAELHARSGGHAEHGKKVTRLFRSICPSRCCLASERGMRTGGRVAGRRTSRRPWRWRRA
jgi:hypothetical protein